MSAPVYTIAPVARGALSTQCEEIPLGCIPDAPMQALRICANFVCNRAQTLLRPYAVIGFCENAQNWAQDFVEISNGKIVAFS